MRGQFPGTGLQQQQQQLFLLIHLQFYDQKIMYI